MKNKQANYFLVQFKAPLLYMGSWDIWILEGFFFLGKASLSKTYYNMYLALFRIIKLITQGKKEEEERGGE